MAVEPTRFREAQVKAIEAVITTMLRTVTDAGVKSVVRGGNFAAELTGPKIFYPAARAAYRALGNVYIRER